MDADFRMRMEGRWDQVKGRVKEAWGSLTDDDLDRDEGNWDRLVGTIRERTGESLDAIETKLKDLFDRADTQ
ncbi:MAG TPA: CsbD family protein [Actinomycetota bacterium]|nr:CsbD family protein [Actinomycetota bacterium]